MTSSKSISLFETNGYSVRLEYTSNFVIVHLPYINKMTKEVFQDMQMKLQEWEEFFRTMGHEAIWAALDPKNEKMVKLATMLGFEYKGQADGMSVFSYRS